MKRLIFFLAILALPILSFGNKTPMADSYYAKGQYKEAAAGYEQMIDEGHQSVKYYYNLGNCYYKLGDIPSALLYYERAHRLSPGDEDINFNIRFANLKTVDKIDEAPEFFLARWWHGFMLSYSVHTLAVSSVVVFLVASGLLILYFFAFSTTLKKTSFFASLALFFVGLLIIGIASLQTSYFNNHKQAIIFSNSVTVKSGPVSSSGTLFVLHEGTEVNVLSTANGWIKIRLANGNEGWMKPTDVKNI